MATQLTFSDYEYDSSGRKTRKSEFLDELDSLVPWDAWAELVREVYDDSEGRRGRPAIGAEAMLRVLNDKLRLLPDDCLYNLARRRRRPGSRLLAVQNGTPSWAPASGGGPSGGLSPSHHSAPSPGSAVHSGQAMSEQSESTSQWFV